MSPDDPVFDEDAMLHAIGEPLTAIAANGAVEPDDLLALLKIGAPGRFAVYDLQQHLACIPGGPLPSWESIASALDAPDCGKAFILRVWPSVPPPLLRYLPMLASLVKSMADAAP